MPTWKPVPDRFLHYAVMKITFLTQIRCSHELLITATYNQSPRKCGILNKHDKEVKFYFSEYRYLVQWWIIWFMDFILCLVFEMEHPVHDRPMYLVCPDLLRAEGESSYGIPVGFIGSTHSVHYLFMYLFICIWGVKSTCVYLIK
jgi:hypothetical protein